MKDYLLTDTCSMTALIGELNRLRGANQYLERENEILKRTIELMKADYNEKNAQHVAAAIERDRD